MNVPYLNALETIKTNNIKKPMSLNNFKQGDMLRVTGLSPNLEKKEKLLEQGILPGALIKIFIKTKNNLIIKVNNNNKRHQEQNNGPP